MSGIGGMSWIGILRCGLVQTCIGAIVVLSTSTYNRVMVVELALPAMLPGALVALHYAVEMARPRWGYGSDMGGSRVPGFAAASRSWRSERFSPPGPRSGWATTPGAASPSRSSPSS
jgi:hypothetical protein